MDQYKGLPILSQILILVFDQFLCLFLVIAFEYFIISILWPMKNNISSLSSGNFSFTRSISFLDCELVRLDCQFEKKAILGLVLWVLSYTTLECFYDLSS